MPAGAELSHYDWYALYAEPAAAVVARKAEALFVHLPRLANGCRVTRPWLLQALTVAVVGAKEQWPDPAAVLDHAERFEPLTCDWRRLDLSPKVAEILSGLARAASKGKRR